MLRKFIYIILAALLLGITMSACKNDNEGYEEYYNPMGNNPVQVIPWLIDVRKSFNKVEANILWYKLGVDDYYVAQSFVYVDEVMESPVTIYEAHDEDKYIYFHSDNVLTAEKDSVYAFFIENATRQELLWSNEPRYSTIEY